MNFKHYSIYPFKKQIAYKCKISCVRRDVCKSPKRASILFYTATLCRILAAVRIARLILWSCWKMTVFWCWNLYIYMCVCMWVFKYSVYSYIHIHNLCVCACIHQRFKELNKKGRRRVKNSFCCFFLRGQFLCWFLAWYHVHPFALYSQQFGTRTSTFWQKHTLSL